MLPERLNLPAQVAQFFIESRLTILLVITLIVFGLIGLTFTPREENPQIIVPAAEISVAMPGASPEEIEHLLLSPLEAELASIDGVKHVYGTASEGLAQVMAEFEVGEDKEAALVRLNERVQRFLVRLPAGAGIPLVKAIDIDDVPVFTVTLTSEKYTDTELRRMAERMLEHLRSVKGVGIGYVIGGRTREFRIEVSPESLQAFGVSLNQIANMISAADVSQTMGLRVYNGQNHALRVEGKLTTIEQVENIVVHAKANQILRLRDIATVVDGASPEHTQMTRFAFGPATDQYEKLNKEETAAVTLAVAKRTGINAVALTDVLRQRVNQMENKFLPPGVQVIITRDDGIKADVTVTRLVEHLIIAIGAVTMVLFWFLGWRAAAIVAITIPLVFAVVMGMDLMAGPTLNRITLYAMILALGMLVDDAIVLAENTHRHYLNLGPDATKEQKTEAAILATHEIGNPTTLATFTVIIVFLSLALVTGMLGEYFYPMQFNVPVAMIASLVIAYSVTPWLARRWLSTAKHRGHTTKSFLTDKYNDVITILLNDREQRHKFYWILMALLILSLLQPAWQFIRPQGVSGAVSFLGVPLAFLPKDDKNTFLIHVHMTEDTPLEVTDRVARELGELLHQQPHVINYQTFVGIPAVIDFNGQLKGSSKRVGPQYAELRVNLVDKYERDLTSIEIVQALRSPVAKIASHYPDSVIQIVEDPPGPPVQATVLAEVYGPDKKTLTQLTHLITNKFRNTYDMAEVWNSIPTTLTEFRIHVDQEKTIIAGVDPTQVTLALTRLMQGDVLAYAHPSGERTPIPIRLHIPRMERIDPKLLDRAFVTNSKGQSIPLSEVTYVKKSTQYKPIQHKDGEQVEYVGGELANSAPVYAVLDIDNRLDQKTFDQENKLQTANLRFNPVRPNSLEGYQVLWNGEVRLSLDAFRDMGLALGMALLAIFLILVGYYRSFKLPLLAMSAVPLAMIGVFPGHWILGVTFSAASMIGVIALAGVVVRNSLLIIDFARDYQEQGYPIIEAVREAGATRLRPILLTTLAIVLGTAIMVPDPVFGGLAISLIFGSMSSAFFGLLVVPLLYQRWVKV